jgi:hypothetical protein
MRAPLHTFLDVRSPDEICLQNKNGASDASFHHRCRHRLLFRLPCNYCHLCPKPACQSHLLGRPSLHCLFKVAFLTPLNILL